MLDSHDPFQAPTPQRRTTIVPMRERDLDEVLAIEQQSFRSVWPRQIFVDELNRNWGYLQALHEGDWHNGGTQVVGYCNYWLVRDEVHLLTIAVHPERRRCGYGALLMKHLLDFARANSCRYVTLEVRRSNAAAIGMYSGYGFRTVGVRPRYYVEESEDALIMTLELSPPTAPDHAPG